MLRRPVSLLVALALALTLVPSGASGRRASVPSVSTVYRVPVGKAPSLGPKRALVTVVLFGGFQCRFTRRALKTLRALQKADPREVRLVFKHFPLAMHNRSWPSAEAAVEAQRQGRFWRFVDALRAGNWALDDAALARAEKRAGLKRGSIATALRKHTHRAAVRADEVLGQRLQITGTPTTFVNGVRVGGAVPAPRFRRVILQQKKIARAWLKKPGVTRANLYARLIQKGIAPGRPRPVAARAPRALVGRRYVPGHRVAASRGSAPGHVSLLHLRDAPAVGSEDALVTVLLFTNFRCSYGNYIWDAFRKMQQEKPGLYRMYFVHHRISRYDRTALQASEAAMAAHAQGRFWEMADILFRYRYGINVKKLEEYATEIGLKMPAYRAAMVKGTYRPLIRRDVKEARRFLAGNQACPTVWVNGHVYRGYISTWKFQMALRKAAREVQGIRARPLP